MHEQEKLHNTGSATGKECKVITIFNSNFCPLTSLLQPSRPGARLRGERYCSLHRLSYCKGFHVLRNTNSARVIPPLEYITGQYQHLQLEGKIKQQCQFWITAVQFFVSTPRSALFLQAEADVPSTVTMLFL